MTPDEAAKLAVMLLRHGLALHATHGDAEAARMLADVRRRDAVYTSTLLGLLLEPLGDEPVALRIVGEDGRAA